MTTSLALISHGNDAKVHAAMRADEFLERGDLDGAAIWRRVIVAIGELESVASGAVFALMNKAVILLLNFA